jgi:hypothetical protein
LAGATKVVEAIDLSLKNLDRRVRSVVSSAGVVLIKWRRTIERVELGEVLLLRP